MSALMELQCGCGRERKIHNGLDCGPLLPTDKEPELTYRELKERLEKCEADYMRCCELNEKLCYEVNDLKAALDRGTE